MNILRITAAALALTGTLAAGAETVTVTKSGSLSEAVTDITATELTVSGPVDAADLFWAADNMKSLKTLNLADATIEAYDGEMLKGRVTYPAGPSPSCLLPERHCPPSSSPPQATSPSVRELSQTPASPHSPSPPESPPSATEPLQAARASQT